MSVILLIVVPPKRGKQTSQRPQPYQPTVRKSARKVTHSVIASRDHSEAPNSSQPKAPKQKPTNQTAKRAPAPPTISQVSLENNDNSQVNDQSILINEDTQPDPQPAQGVSRLEFQTLQASMNSMRDLFTSFMNNMTSTDNTNPQSQPVNVLPNQQPTVVQQTITSQPVSLAQSDPNIGPPVQPVNIGPPAQPAQINHSDEVVQRAIAAHVSTMVGPTFPGKQNEGVSYQLDRKVSQSLIQEIWDEKYIDFCNLLEKSDDMEQGLIVKYAEPGEPLTLVPPKGKSQITSIKQWSQAFDIFHSIYSRKYPHQTHNLLTYAATVKDLAAQGGDYLRYDQEFRRARSHYGIPWEVPENIMWTTCSQTGIRNHINQVLADLVSTTTPPSFTNLPTHQPTTTQTHTFQEPTINTPKTPKPQPFPVKSNTSTQSSSTGNTKTPKDPITNDDTKLKHPNGYCYSYHNKGTCMRDRCQYLHRCWVPGCGREHSVYVCPDLAKHFNIPGISNSQPNPATKTTSNSN